MPADGMSRNNNLQKKRQDTGKQRKDLKGCKGNQTLEVKVEKGNIS